MLVRVTTGSATTPPALEITMPATLSRMGSMIVGAKARLPRATETVTEALSNPVALAVTVWAPGPTSVDQ